MFEGQVGGHTVRSHGVALARTHIYDWLILILLAVILFVLNMMHPFYRYIDKDMISDLKYPTNSVTVYMWVVPIYAIVLPIVIFLLFYRRRRDVYDLHHAILGLLFSIFITAVLTLSVIVAVGRPRPDFFWRCFPNGKDAYDHWGNVICHGDTRVIRNGRKSFPSGHASWSFAGLTFLSLYLSGKIKVFDHSGHVAKLSVVFVPLFGASLVGITRVNDYQHHWQDVLVGSLLGLVVATICYLQFFPPPYHVHGWRTYAYLRVLEETRTNTNNVQTPSAVVETQSDQRDQDSSLPIEDLESGRYPVNNGIMPRHPVPNQSG